MKSFKAALDDLSRAIALDSKIPEFYRIRAAAHRALNNIQLALEDEKTAAAMGK